MTSSEIGIMREMRRTKRIGKTITYLVRGDIGEMQGRYGGDVGEIWRRCRDTITYLVRSRSRARVGIGLGLGLGLGG